MPGWDKLYIAATHVKGQCDLMLLACIYVTRARYIRGRVRVCAFSPRVCAFPFALTSPSSLVSLSFLNGINRYRTLSRSMGT